MRDAKENAAIADKGCGTQPTTQDARRRRRTENAKRRPSRGPRARCASTDRRAIRLSSGTWRSCQRAKPSEAACKTAITAVDPALAPSSVVGQQSEDHGQGRTNVATAPSRLRPTRGQKRPRRRRRRLRHVQTNGRGPRRAHQDARNRPMRRRPREHSTSTPVDARGVGRRRRQRARARPRQEMANRSMASGATHRNT